MDRLRNHAEGRVEGGGAIITGARTGIGRIPADQRAYEGATVVVTHHEDNGAQDTVESIREGGGEAVQMTPDALRLLTDLSW